MPGSRLRNNVCTHGGRLEHTSRGHTPEGGDGCARELSERNVHLRARCITRIAMANVADDADDAFWRVTAPSQSYESSNRGAIVRMGLDESGVDQSDRRCVGRVGR